MSFNDQKYGGMYIEDGSVTVALTSGADNYYPIASGFTAGTLRGVTFQNSHELLVLSAGVYMVSWSLTIEIDSTNQLIEGCITVNNVEKDNTANAQFFKTANEKQSLSSFGIITIVSGDVVRLTLENETSSGKTATVNHANVVIVRIL